MKTPREEAHDFCRHRALCVRAVAPDQSPDAHSKRCLEISELIENARAYGAAVVCRNRTSATPYELMKIPVIVFAQACHHAEVDFPEINK